MIGKYFKHIGFCKSKSNQGKVAIQEVYTPSKSIEVAKLYLTYLKEIDSYHKERRITIENKNSQMVGQASIVASIFSLFIPLFIENFMEMQTSVKIVLCCVFLFVLLHYLLTISHSVKTLKIDKYQYATRSTLTLTKTKRNNSELKFLNEEIEDLIYTINSSAIIDNKKGDNLIFSARCFEIANFGFGILTFLVLFISLTKPSKESNVNNCFNCNTDLVKTENPPMNDSLKALKDNKTVFLNPDTMKPLKVSIQK